MARLPLEIDGCARGASRLAFIVLNLTAACWLLPADAAAGRYNARVRWAPSTSAGIVEYEVYRRPVTGSYGAAEPGVPTSGTGGMLSLVVSNLDVRTDYAFVVKAVATSGSSPLSNELRIGFADVAALLDTDGDGLTEAEEDLNLNRRVDAGESNPDSADSDGDGIGDPADTCEGTAAGSTVSGVGCACAQLACNNGNACDGVESCSAGVCRSGTAPVCSDANVCTSDSCDPASGCRNAPIAGCATCTSAAQCNDGNPCTTDACTGGRCQSTQVTNGTACGDSNSCNGAETCQAGTCRAGAPPSCNDANPCTTDSCDPASGCRNLPAANGTACGDGNACNGGETCQAGMCLTGTALSCGDGNPCTNDTCDATSGCRHSQISGCSTCTSAAQCNDGNPCTTEACTGGRCESTQVANGTVCGDANVCNGAEICQAGSCRPGTTLHCNDTNPCTSDSCDATAGCRNAPVANGAACADGNACNGAETCQAGVCGPGTAITCGDGNPCTTDTCDAATGCRNTPVTGCSSCTTTAQCDDGNACTTDTCSGATCRHAPVGNGTPCADGNACNGAETCQAGACKAGTAPSCADTDPCTTDTCDPATGCRSRLAADGASCSDGNACNGTETCRAGSCQPGTAPRCADTNPCTIDSCVPASGCMNRPIEDGTSCGQDRGFCGGTDVCRAGVCALGGPPDCDDDNSCTSDACDDALGRCAHQSRADCCRTDADCADSDACTTDERCQQGTCVSTPLACADPGACADSSRCDPVKGCVVVPVADGTTCDDGNPCSTGDACTSGHCAARTTRTCPDPGPCAVGRCDDITGCTSDAVPDGTPCDDGDACTETEACAAGLCRATSARAADLPLSVERFSVRSAGRSGQRLRGRVMLPWGKAISLRGDLGFEITSAAGTLLYRIDVHATALEVEPRRGGMRMWLRSPDPRLRRLVLHVRGNDVRVLFTIVGEGVIPSGTTAVTLKLKGGDSCSRQQALVCGPRRGRGLRCASLEHPPGSRTPLDRRQGGGEGVGEDGVPESSALTDDEPIEDVRHRRHDP